MLSPWGKGSGQSDSVYNNKGKESYSKFIINLQAQTVPGREPLSSIEMAVMLRHLENSDGLSVTVMGNGLSYTNDFYQSSGSHTSILSLLDIAVFELVRKLYRIPPLITDKADVLAYYGDDFEIQQAEDQIATIKNYLNVVLKKLEGARPQETPAPKSLEDSLAHFYASFGKSLGLQQPEEGLTTLTSRRQVFTDLAYTYSRITLYGLKKAIEYSAR